MFQRDLELDQQKIVAIVAETMISQLTVQLMDKYVILVIKGTTSQKSAGRETLIH